MSTSVLSFTALVVAAVAMIILIVTDHFQPARHRFRPGRGTPPHPSRSALAAARHREAQGSGTVVVELYRRPRWWQRLRALFSLGVVTILIGLALAVVVGVVIAAFVILLRQALG